MKQLSCLFLLLVLLGCEDNFEDTHRYSKLITSSKDYPIYLDMMEIGDIQVRENSTLLSPFKILSNDNYYFVGDMLKGVHVYEKEASRANYLCFIECRYIKDFELTDNLLFCNNLVDMVVIDVNNPMEINILHRQKNHFNRFSGYKEHWNIPYENEKGPIVGTERHELTGTVTEEQPNLDFSEYDQLYGNLTSKVIPDNWFSDHPEYDKPYLGIIKLGTDEIYTYGTYNSWTICTYPSEELGVFKVREVDLWTEPRGNYAPPYYYSDAFPVRMFFEDNMVYILGAAYNNSGYCDCITYNKNYPLTYHLYFPDFRPLDITYMQTMQAFFVLSGQSIWVAYKSSDSVYMERYIDYEIPTDATSIFNVGNNVLTLGNHLSVYSPSENQLKLVKEYPEISGTCYSKVEDVLTIANTQGIFFYDITDLENIQLIP